MQKVWFNSHDKKVVLNGFNLLDPLSGFFRPITEPTRIRFVSSCGCIIVSHKNKFFWFMFKDFK